MEENASLDGRTEDEGFLSFLCGHLFETREDREESMFKMWEVRFTDAP